MEAHSQKRMIPSVISFWKCLCLPLILQPLMRGKREKACADGQPDARLDLTLFCCHSVNLAGACNWVKTEGILHRFDVLSVFFVSSREHLPWDRAVTWLVAVLWPPVSGLGVDFRANQVKLLKPHEWNRSEAAKADRERERERWEDGGRSRPHCEAIWKKSVTECHKRRDDRTSPYFHLSYVCLYLDGYGYTKPYRNKKEVLAKAMLWWFTRDIFLGFQIL